MNRVSLRSGLCMPLLIITATLLFSYASGQTQSFLLSSSESGEETGPSTTLPRPGPERINFAHFVPDGSLITVGYHVPDREPYLSLVFGDILISRWDPATGEREELYAVDEKFENTAISPDGKYLASWDDDRTDQLEDGTVTLFHVERGKQFGQQFGVLGGLTRSISDVAFSPDSKVVAVAYRDDLTQVRLFNRADTNEIGSLRSDSAVEKLAISNDGKFMAGMGDKMITIWNVAAKRTIGRVDASNADGFAFSDRSNSLVVLNDQEKKALEFNIDNGSLAKTSRAFDFGKAVQLTGASITDENAYGQLEFIDRVTGDVLMNLRLKQKPKPENHGVPPAIEITYDRWGVHATSKDGRFALVDLQMVDLKERKVYSLDLNPQSDVDVWELLPTR